jgi:phage tail sheath protein FI
MNKFLVMIYTTNGPGNKRRGVRVVETTNGIRPVNRFATNVVRVVQEFESANHADAVALAERLNRVAAQ